MKRLPVLGLALAFAACSPDIPAGNTNPQQFVTAEFDPATGVIPTPNDLLFLNPATGQLGTTLNAPTTGGTPAQNEFYANYLNLLDGFPMETPASVLFSQPIDLTSVVLYPQTGANLVVLDITIQTSPQVVPALKVTTSPAANGAQNLNIIPSSGFWTRGHHYGVLVVGGPNGLKGATAGQTVTGSPTWALVSGGAPVLACDADGGNCRPGSSVLPVTGTDPSAQYNSQLQVAKQLNVLQQSYAPLIAGALVFIPGLTVSDIAIGFTFLITSQAEVTFNPDPANPVIPFPNDILNPTGHQVALPVPADAGALTVLTQALNTLDGFSTSAPIVSENGDGTGPLIQGTVNASTVALGQTGTMNLVQAAPGTGAAPTTPDGGIRAHACLNCPGITMNYPDGGPVRLSDGGVKPDTLAIVLDIPLTERTQYAAYITTDLKDTTNKNVIPTPLFALVRSSAPLIDGGKSTVSSLTNEQAAALEPLRAALAPLFNGLAAQGLPRSKIALAWAFTTESTMSALSQLHAAPTVANVPSAPLWIADVTAQVVPQLDAAGVPHNNIAAFWSGEIYDLFALNAGTGTFLPGLAGAAPKKMPFVMAIPTGTAPAAGWPVTMFGHGFSRTRTDSYIIANTLATAAASNNKPQVTIAIDETWHGERATCTGFGAYLNTATGQTLFTDAYACISPTNQQCNSVGRCQTTNRATQACTYAAPTSDLVCSAVGQGGCAPDGFCEGPGAGFATGVTVAPGVTITVSGWNIFNLQNFFVSRDNFRQQTISSAQLARVIAATGPAGFTLTAPGVGTVNLDPTQISYVGQSLGSLLGALYTSVAPEIGNAALDVAGSDWELNLLTSPSFAAYKSAFVAGLAALGIPQYSPAYDQFLGIGKWIIDPADPLNTAYYMTHSARLPAPLPPNINPATRRALVQWILDDQTVVNPSTIELVNAASGTLLADTTRVSASPLWSYQYNNSTNLNPFNAGCAGGCSLSAIPTTARHSFLLAPYPNASGLAATTSAQSQVSTFVGGATPPFP